MANDDGAAATTTTWDTAALEELLHDMRGVVMVWHTTEKRRVATIVLSWITRLEHARRTNEHRQGDNTGCGRGY